MNCHVAISLFLYLARFIIHYHIMRQTLFILFLLFSLFAYAQAIKTNEVNGFTDERTIETTIVTLKQGFSTGFGISYTAVDNNYFLNFIGYGRGSTMVDSRDQVWMVLEDGSVIKCEHRVDMDYRASSYQNIYIHHYFVSPADIEVLRNHRLAIVRIMGPGGFKDVPVSKKGSRDFSTLSAVFLQEIKKYWMAGR